MKHPLLALAISASVCASSAAALEASEIALAIAPDAPHLQWGPCPEIFPGGCEITVLHGDPSRPNADAFLRAPAGYEFPAHAHTSAERMILVSGALKVRYAGQPETVLKQGTYAYGPALAPHTAKCVSDTPCVLFIAFVSPVDAMLTDAPLD